LDESVREPRTGDSIGEDRHPIDNASKSALVDKLRDEIIESQKARADLSKWKLILIAAIGGAALGLGEKADPAGAATTRGILALFALLPLACLYVDVVCIHNDLRMMVIGRFLRMETASDVGRYEEFCEKFRRVFGLENFALTGTTVVISAVVAAIGFSAHGGQGSLGMSPDSINDLLVISAAAVLAVSGWLFLWKTVRLKDLANDTLSHGWAMSQWTVAVFCVLGVVFTLVPVLPAEILGKPSSQVSAAVFAVLALVSALIGIKNHTKA
jgi:hypothetical protein